MRCEELMSKDAQCISPQESLESAARLMRDADVGFLPVCSADGRVLGTLTDRDIAVRAVAEGAVEDSMVEDIMSGDVVSCSPSDDVREAEQKMKAMQKSRIVCLDSDGTLRGVISLSDIARIEDEEHAASALRDVKQPAASQPLHH